MTLTPGQVELLARVLPTVGICINLAAAAVYFTAAITMQDGQYARRCVYWLAAAILTASVTY